MKIEILTGDINKKPDVISLISGWEGFGAAGGKVSARGAEAEIADRYIYLTVTVPWMADQLIRALFTVRPVAFAPSFYEIAGDARVIATFAARTAGEIILALGVIDHIDFEAGEIAGRFENRWSSRDVSVSASYEVMVQGGVGVARVKFTPHFRETETNCRAAISGISLARGLSPVTAEINGLAGPPAVSAVSLRASAGPEGEALAEFLNRCPGRLSFREEAGEYRLDLPGEGNQLIISRKGAGAAAVKRWKI